MSTDRPVSHLLPSLTVASVLDQPGAGGCGLLFSCEEPVPLFCGFENGLQKMHLKTYRYLIGIRYTINSVFHR